MNRRDLERISLLAKIKKMEERLCALELAKVRRKISVIEEEINNVVEERRSMFTDIGSLFLSSSLLDVKDYYSYVKYLEYEMSKLEKKLEDLRREETGKKDELEKKIQKRKTFEKLQERKESELEYWLNKEFQKGLDDIVNSRWSFE